MSRGVVIEANIPATRSRRNVVANYMSVAAKLLSHVLLVPVYVIELGQERFGVIGFFLSLQSVLLMFDFGLGVSLNRELARRSAQVHPDDDLALLVRSVEALSWLSGILLGLAVWVLAVPIGTRWLTTSTLSDGELIGAVRWMGIALAVQWPMSIYNGGLQGIQRQQTLVAVTIGSNLVFAAGAIGLLRWEPTLRVFFVWRVAVSIATVLLSRQLLLQYLPGKSRKFFDWSASLDVRKFSGDMSTIALTGVALAQLDKLLASKFLPLEVVGAYMVASTGASLVTQLGTPVFSAYFPQLSQAFAQDDEERSVILFRRETQLISLFVQPAALVVTFFAQPLLFFWTGSAKTADAASPILATLAVGSAINSIMVPIYSVQLAAGWTQIAIRGNLLLIAVTVPAGILLTRSFGEWGAASTWLAMNALYLVIGCAWTVGKLPKGTITTWLSHDVGKPIMIGLIVVAPARALAAYTSSPALHLLLAAVGGILAGLAVLRVHPELWSTFRSGVEKFARRNLS
jgi:O-antigen/teichoic acid export membrane protein